MNKTVKWLLIFSGLAVAGYFAVQKFKGDKAVTKQDKVTVIIQRGCQTCGYGTLMTFDDTYIDYWYKAVLAGQATFTINNKSYSSRTGKAI